MIPLSSIKNDIIRRLSIILAIIIILVLFFVDLIIKFATVVWIQSSEAFDIIFITVIAIWIGDKKLKELNKPLNK